jgi:hypothetical protein
MNRVNKWKIKIDFFSFVTGLGRHTAVSFGKDLGLHSFKKTIVNSMLENGGKLTSDHFSSAHQLLGRIELGMRTISVIGKVTAGLMDHDSRSTTNFFTSITRHSNICKLWVRYAIICLKF